MARARKADSGATVDAAPDSAVPIARPSPKSGYALTLADARKGRAAQAAKQREQREEAKKNALQRLAEKLEEKADVILASYMAAIDAGDWRAAEALYDRVYGKATQRTEVDDVSERREIPEEAVIEALGIRDQLAAKRQERRAATG